MTVDLHHHGDRDTASGLVDLAVNVRLPGPPPWIAEAVIRTVSDLGSYPDPRAATRAIARRHGVPEESVLPTAGGAEAFTLIARAVAGVEPWVVHPQFTEPEAALVTAGRPVRRHLLAARAGFVLDPEAFGRQGVGAGGDLLIVGNPTNPTGVLHRRSDLLALRRPGRVVVVDEAFMDVVPGESESLIGSDLEGLLVVRSLTKTWGLAGLRAGYVVGDPALVAALGDAQPPWSVSSPALAATIACVSARGRAEAEAAAVEIGRHRAHACRRARRAPRTGPPAAPPPSAPRRAPHGADRSRRPQPRPRRGRGRRRRRS